MSKMKNKAIDLANAEEVTYLKVNQLPARRFIIVRDKHLTDVDGDEVIAVVYASSADTAFHIWTAFWHRRGLERDEMDSLIHVFDFDSLLRIGSAVDGLNGSKEAGTIQILEGHKKLRSYES